jgi:hypothetical protein
MLSIALASGTASTTTLAGGLPSFGAVQAEIRHGMLIRKDCVIRLHIDEPTSTLLRFAREQDADGCTVLGARDQSSKAYAA